jgi:hypothetical protein
MLNNGPPELPLLIAASVWMKLSYVRALLDVAAAGGHDPGRDRSAPAERIADCQHPVAHPSAIGIAERHRGKRLLGNHLQDCDVGAVVLSDQRRLEHHAVMQCDGDLVGAIDDVVVGHHDAGRVDDEARTKALRPARGRVPLAAGRGIVAAGRRIGARRGARRTVAFHEVAEEPFERRSGRKLRHLGAATVVAGRDGLAGRDVDNRGQEAGRQVGEAFGCRARLGIRHQRRNRRDHEGEGECRDRDPQQRRPWTRRRGGQNVR